MSEIGVADADLVYLSDLHELKVLHLDANNATSEGMVHLADFRKLKYLHLQDCPIDDQCIDELIEFRKLSLLNVRGTNLSNAGIQKLRNEMPSTIFVTSDDF